MKKLSISLFAVLMFLFCSLQAMAQNNAPSWSAWVQVLRVDALKDGIKPELFDSVFGAMPGPSASVLKYYHTQPEGRMTFAEYRQTRANKPRIQMGRQELIKNKALLNGISKTYGVDPCFILALWGLETDYGRFMGNFPVPQSLATLAYASKRPEFFRRELLESLHILQEGHVSLANFKGEWAGASGHPQFLPSSWYKYAVDYNEDGRKDIWNTLPDALASIANYLSKNSWQLGQPWAMEVTLPDHFDSTLLGKTVVKSVGAWRNLGVKGVSLPPDSLLASIIQQDGDSAFMIFHNFRVLQTWNDSNYYVGTVGYLSDQICVK